MDKTFYHTTRRDLFAAIGAGLAIRAAFLMAMRRAIDMPDAIHYIEMGKQFAAGSLRSFDENLPVLYPLLGALAHLAAPDWEWAFRLVSLVSSSLLVIPVYLLALELFGRKPARVSAFMVVLWPWLVDYAGRIAPESLAAFLWFLSILLVYRGVERGRAWPVAAALTLFLLHLTRPEGTFILIAAPVGAFALCYGRGTDHYRRLAGFAAACYALLSAYAATMYIAIGRATVSYRAPLAGDLVDYFRRGGTEIARTFMQLFFNELPVMLGPILLLFLGVGVFQTSETPRKIRLEFLIFFFCLAQFGLTLANFSPAPRYIMTVVVALSIWSARGVALVAERADALPRWRALRFAPAAAVAAVMLIGLASNLASEHLGRMPSMPREYKFAGTWMKENLEPGYIISRKPQVGFYADMPTTGPGAEDGPDEVVAMAKAIGARYLVVDERYTAQLVPGLRGLLDPANAPDTLKLRKADLSPYEGARIVIYEIAPPGIEYLTKKEFPRTSSHMGPDEQRRRKSAPGE